MDRGLAAAPGAATLAAGGAMALARARRASSTCRRQGSRSGQVSGGRCHLAVDVGIELAVEAAPGESKGGAVGDVIGQGRIE